MNRSRCIFDQTRNAALRGCLCPNCIQRREKARLYFKRRYANPEWRAKKIATTRTEISRRYYSEPAFRQRMIDNAKAYYHKHHLARLLYNGLRYHMMRDGSWL